MECPFATYLALATLDDVDPDEFTYGQLLVLAIGLPFALVVNPMIFYAIG